MVSLCGFNFHIPADSYVEYFFLIFIVMPDGAEHRS